MSIPVNLIVQSKDLGDLIVFYEGKLKSTKEKRKALEKDESEIRAVIAQLKSKLSVDLNNAGDYILYSVDPNKASYDKNWTWISKIDFAIREAGKPVTTTEIADILIIYEPKFEDDKRRTVASISSILSINSGDDGTKVFLKINEPSGRSKFFIKQETISVSESPKINEDIEDYDPGNTGIPDLPF